MCEPVSNTKMLISKTNHIQALILATVLVGACSGAARNIARTPSASRTNDSGSKCERICKSKTEIEDLTKRARKRLGYCSHYKRDSEGALERVCGPKPERLHNAYGDCKKALSAYCEESHNFRVRLKKEYLDNLSSYRTRTAIAALNAWPIVSGISSFLIDRFKQELLVPIIAQIKDKMCNQDKVGMVLTQTCEYFDHGKVDISSGSLALLVEALRQDLLTLPINLLRVVENDALHARLLAELFTRIVKELRNGRPQLASILEAVADSLEQSAKPPHVREVLAVASLLRLISASKGTNTAIFVDTTVRLLEQTDNCIPSSRMKDWKRTLLKVPGAVRRIQDAITLLNRPVRPKGSIPGGVVATAARDMSWIVLAVLEPYWERTKLPLDRLKTLIPSVAESIGLMAANEYAKGTLMLLKLVPALTKDRSEEAIEKLKSSLLRLVPLATALAQAKNAEGVKKALESAAAPVGTWRLKRRSHMISIGALVGVNGGYELPVRPSMAESSLTFGVYASLGIDFSWHCSATEKCPSTFGVFLSVIDVGTVLSYHHSIGDDETLDTDNTPKISLAQVFSPGVYLRWGVCNTPLVVGAGVSLAPRLLSVTETDNGTVNTEERKDRTVFRFMAFFAVDIPILELWTGEPASH